MGTDAAAERGEAAIRRLRELMAVSRQWRAEHPEQVPARPGGFPSREKRRAERERLERHETAMLVYGAAGPDFPVPPESTARYVVTGELREDLLDWLPLVTSFWSADGELAELGDVTSGRAARLAEVLAAEGFGLVQDAPLDERHRMQLWVHPEDGLLAEVNATTLWQPGGSWVAESVRVHGCVEALDYELLVTGAGSAHLVHIPGMAETTRFAQVCIRSYLSRPERSLRVSLAVLRAAARPALPWPAPGISGWLGPAFLTYDDAGECAGRFRSPASEVASFAALAELPAVVHDLFGPNLMSRSRG
ncbi:hypothetical protein [Amycolatopsis rubida]|uniref:Uncharacterized protein n=1 Tax=Amycolatopsis rubida TaxID=112413 RepID=A0A1I5X767_9PSEU|nr:hypothetical protein [Amycolatopsis rubida]SFQ27839.1 hypothetical protein SAMN05421854_11074 [Amycolatopsis rubida]